MVGREVTGGWGPAPCSSSVWPSPGCLAVVAGPVVSQGDRPQPRPWELRAAPGPGSQSLPASPVRASGEVWLTGGRCESEHILRTLGEPGHRAGASQGRDRAGGPRLLCRGPGGGPALGVTLSNAAAHPGARHWGPQATPGSSSLPMSPLAFEPAALCLCHVSWACGLDPHGVRPFGVLRSTWPVFSL